jgi:hypothetical protein
LSRHHWLLAVTGDRVVFSTTCSRGMDCVYEPAGDYLVGSTGCLIVQTMAVGYPEAFLG